MNKDRVIQISKFLCKFLRHSPEKLRITLDSAGWVDIYTLLLACHNYGFPISLNDLSIVVEQDDKQRFSIKEGRIRANQGHSIPVDLELTSVKPPVVLYHGTATRFLDSILSGGLTKQKRTHVHLTKDIEVAKSVGSKHGEPVVLIVDSYGMYGGDYDFYLTENNVWLTDRVPKEYLKVYVD